ARVLRLPNTINPKNNQECRVIYQDDKLEYSMYDLREQFLNYDKKKKLGKVIKENKKVIKNAFFNSYSLHIARVEDIITLCELRNYNVRGYRNMIIHCYAYWIGIYERDEEVLQEKVEELNDKFLSPLRQSEIRSILRSVDKAVERFIEYNQSIGEGKDKRVTKGMRDKGGYWYKNETLIERLDITENEQKNMKTIIGIRVKYDRKNKKRNENRRNENGLTEKQQELEDLKINVTELKKKGYNNSQIAKELKINRTKVIRILKEI
ncbi:MAG: DNA-binding response regulator, partial [Clostridium sp.]